jgi:hypothetical protein
LIETGNDAMSVGLKSIGITVQTQPERRNGFTYVFSDENTNVAISARSEKVVDIAFSSKAVSALQVEV